MLKHDEDDKQTIDELKDLGYDTRDVPVEKMPIHAGVLYGFVGIVMVVAWLFMSLVDNDLVTVPSAESMERSRMPDDGIPIIQGPVTAKTDIEELRLAEKIGLSTSTWIDKDAGVARIPVDVAIALMLEEGFAPPVRGQTVPARPTIEVGTTGEEPEAAPEIESGETPGAELMAAEENE